MSSVTVHITGSGGAPGQLAAWVHSSKVSVARTAKTANLVVHTHPKGLPLDRSDKITVAVVDTDVRWAEALRRSSIDAIVALNDATRAAQPLVPFDPGSLDTPFDDVVEQVHSKPRIAIGTSVRFRNRAELWGDTHFARDIGDALRRLGWRTEVQTHRTLTASKNAANDALLYLRGLRPSPAVVTPSVMWVISHPAQVTPGEVAPHGTVFAAGTGAAQALGATELLQATDPNRFVANPIDESLRGVALFVGLGRGRERQSVSHATDSQVPLRLIGPGWKRTHKENLIAPTVANVDLHRYYSAAGIVLNDHLPEMIEFAIPSNRLFDAVASGAPVLSDRIDGIESLFGDAVRTFTDREEFASQAFEMLAAAPTSEIRRRWRERVVANHTFDHRAQLLDQALRPLL